MLNRPILTQNQFTLPAFSYQPLFQIAGSRFGLRWFTPTNEVNLCGHATLASAAVLFQCYDNQNAKLEFETLSGVLSAEISESGFINLNLPLGKTTEQVTSYTA